MSDREEVTNDILLVKLLHMDQRLEALEELAKKAQDLVDNLQPLLEQLGGMFGFANSANASDNPLSLINALGR